MCSIEGCGRPEDCRTWCKMHWKRWKKYGDPLLGRVRYSDPALAFAARTQWRGGCLIWTGSRISAGYGNMRIGESNKLAHRFAWEQVRGPIPSGLDVDHTCFTPACCNVQHLRLATRKQNLENHQGPTAASTSGVRGVYRSKSGKWATQVTHHQKRHTAGTFLTLEEAESAIVLLRNRLFTRNDRDRRAS